MFPCLLHRTATFLVMTTALPAEDIRRIALNVVSVLRDTPFYNPLASTLATGVAISDKISLCLLSDTPI